MEKGRTPLTGSTFTAADFDAARAEPVVLAAQQSSQWKAPQFVWQVRKELTERLCGDDTETCPKIERGGLTVTTSLDMRLQGIAEKWVKAATVVPNAKNPRATAKALGLPYEAWMDNLRSRDLHNGALVAMDYETGEIVAYVGSADANARRATKKFQPRFDVLADGWRQPGSAFKPVVYSTGIAQRSITAATMFMDVVTNFGGGYTPTDADNLERGPVRVRDALSFSLNIPAVKSMAVIGNRNVQAQAEAMGVEFQDGQVDAGLSFALGVEVVHPLDLVRAYGVLGNKGRIVDQTTIRTVVDSNGEVLVEVSERAKPEQVLDEGAAFITTDILAANTNPNKNPFWGRFAINDGGRRRPATLKTGTSNEARDLNAYGFIGAPDTAARKDGEYALVVGAWNGNSDNSLVSRPGAALFSIDVTTYVWQGLPRGGDEGLDDQRLRGAERARPRRHRPLDGPAAVAGRRGDRRAVPPRHRPHGGAAPGSALRRRRACQRRLRGRARGLAGRRPRLADPCPEGPRNARRSRGHRDGVLLQPILEPVRPVLGSDHGRPRLRQAEREPICIDRPVCIARRASRPVGVAGRHLPHGRAADRGTHGAADGSAHRAAHAGADAAADPRADAATHARAAVGGPTLLTTPAVSAPSQDLGL